MCKTHKDQTSNGPKSERTGGQNRRFGKLLLEPFNHSVFLPILVCNCPLENPGIQKPGKSATTNTLSRCWTVRIQRGDRGLSIKECWVLSVQQQPAQAGSLISMKKSGTIIATSLWAICEANQHKIVAGFPILMTQTQRFSDILNLFSQKYKTRKISICTQTLVK